MTLPSHSTRPTPAENRTRRLETLQQDLLRLSGTIAHLSECSDETMDGLSLDEPLNAIHTSLRRLENRCLALGLTNPGLEMGIPSEVSERTSARQNTNRWNALRKDAIRAHHLATQLSVTLAKIRADLNRIHPHMPIPADILEISQTVGNSLSSLASGWNDPID